MSVRVSVRVIKIAPAILFFAGAFHPLLVQTNRTHKMKTNKKKKKKHHTMEERTITKNKEMYHELHL